MSNEEKKFDGIQKIQDEEMGGVAGRFIGPDWYDNGLTYKSIGITHVKNLWSRDEYYYGDKKLTKKQAHDLLEMANDMASGGAWHTAIYDAVDYRVTHEFNK